MPTLLLYKEKNMPKFFVKEEQIKENQIHIIGMDINHMKNVLRLSIGEQVEITCPELEKNYVCEIQEYSKDIVICNILEQLEKQTEPGIYIHIFQGLPKADKMEWIIEKGTEIGVSEFTPIEMKRCVVKLDDKAKIKKQQRWQKIAEVAAKQSGRNRIPIVHSVENLKNSYEIFKKYDIVLMAYEKEEKQTLKQVLSQQEKKENMKIAVVIGPEGGIDSEEWSVLTNNGAISISLGKRILRTETAPLVMASNLIYEFET